MCWESKYCVEKRQLSFDQSVYLWVLIDFLRFILIAVNVKPDGCPSTACPAETEDDTRTISEDDPQTLKIMKTGNRDDGQHTVFWKVCKNSMKLRKVFRQNISKTVLLNCIYMRYFKHNEGHYEAILSSSVI